jgi:hypothetical protein
MKPIRKDELYENISQFLKDRGVELKEGSYTKSIHAGCSLLADAINLSQAGLERAKTEIEKQFDTVRQVIHEKTAPNKGAKTASSRQSSKEASSKSTGTASPTPGRSKASQGKGPKRRKPGAK